MKRGKLPQIHGINTCTMLKISKNQNIQSSPILNEGKCTETKSRYHDSYTVKED